MRTGVVALLGALSIVACGRGGGGGSSTAVTTGAPHDVPKDGGQDGPKTPCPDGVAITLLGTHPGEVSHLALRPDFVGASCAPTATSCTVGKLLDEAIELSAEGVGYRLGTLQAPLDGAPVTVSLSFIAATATLAGRADFADICTGPISFTFDPSRVNHDRCSVTVILDIGRSVVSNSAGLSFLPQFRVFF